MIRILNYFLGILFQYLLLVVIKIFPHLRVQLGIIVNRITEVNRLGQGFSEYLIDSLILIEDKRHFQHFGVDFYSMLRAIFNNIWSNRREGASTITQQLVRCVTGDVASPKFKTVPKTTELLTLNSQNLYEEEPIYGGSDDQSH